MEAEVEENLRALARALGRPLPEPAVAPLVAYAGLVQTWNAKLNLTGAKGGQALGEVLFADALVVADEAFVASGARVLDVGTGAGAPAIPLAVLRPDLRVCLVEPLHKRIAFLRTVIGTLDLAARVEAHETSVDPDAPAAPGGPFDAAMARATFAPERWLEIGGALAGRVLVFVVDTPMVPARFVVEQRASYALPSTGAPRIALALTVKAP